MTEMSDSPKRPKGGRPARTVVIDSHALLREAISGLLGGMDRIGVIHLFASPAEAKTAALDEIDLVVLRLDEDEAAFFSQVKGTRTAFPDARLLVLASPRIAPLAPRLLRSGVHGIFLTTADAGELEKAAGIVLRGEPYLHRRLAERLVSEPDGGSETGEGTNPATALSDRELEIFCLVGNGRTTRQIAESLFISRKTVEAHKENIKTKLGLESAAELARTAALWVGQDDFRAIA